MLEMEWNEKQIDDQLSVIRREQLREMEIAIKIGEREKNSKNKANDTTLAKAKTEERCILL